jgi:hypothetical protein
MRYIRNDLAAIEIFVRAWLIEYKEHLFNELGEETYEPIFNISYLKLIVKHMFDLSSQIFGSSFFTYDCLAASLRESDLNRIKLAVRRIAIILRGYNKNNDLGIWVGEQSWKWLVREDRKVVNYFEVAEIHKILSMLGDPVKVGGMK